MKINPWKLSTLALAPALVLSLAVGSATSAPQPMMRKALASLMTARTQLEKATADKGGHRVKAIELVNQAIDEVKAGIEYDNTH
ncbi:MAG TPA: hypothetical protein VHE35_23685 [Kofleriaceae bacterium]|nr:hypothetical protein [Kofleriaceae bacterium]